MDDLISREALIKYLISKGFLPTIVRIAIETAPAIDVETISDGYHTFADLYEQRMILSAALAKNNPDAWKSKLHDDGTEPFGGGWFIVGFDTDAGPYTYHYELKDWDLFQCKELPKAKPWDGHTSKDVRRLLSLRRNNAVEVVRCRECIMRDPPDKYGDLICHILGVPMRNDDFCSYGEMKDAKE